MHGGFVLYNGGFNAGLAAIILIPLLDFYKVAPKKVDDDEIIPVENYKKGPILKLIDFMEKHSKNI